jgi:WS/DGAT/MGAT family acyltransferase
MWVVEGLEHGFVGIVAKLHHSSIDGVSGADLMVNLFDLTPDVAVTEPDGEWQPEKPPSALHLAGAAAASQARLPFGVASTLWKTGQGLLRAGLQRRREPASDAPPSSGAPSTPFNGAITPHRSVAYGRVSLDDVKATKNATGTKVNDVVLAACTQSLRQWLIAHDQVPDASLVAACPMAVPVAEGEERPTNAMTLLMVPLPVHLADPVDQLKAINEASTRAKRGTQALGVDVLQGWAEYTAPSVISTMIRLYSNFDLADRHGPLANLIVSNIPGPPMELYCAGARVVATYPMGPLMEGVGLNVTVLSNMGNVDFGVIACRELVADIWDLATGFEDAVLQLRKATEGSTV